MHMYRRNGLIRGTTVVLYILVCITLRVYATPSASITPISLDSDDLYQARFVANGGFTVTRRRFNYTLTVASVYEIDESGLVVGAPIELVSPAAREMYSTPIIGEYRIGGNVDTMVRKNTKVYDSSGTPGIPMGATITVDALMASDESHEAAYEYSKFESQYIYSNELSMILTVRNWFSSDFAARVDNHMCFVIQMDAATPVMSRKRRIPIIAHAEVVQPLSDRIVRPVTPDAWTLTPNNTEITIKKTVSDVSFDFVALRDRLFLRDTPSVVTVNIAKVTLRDPMLVDLKRQATLASAPLVDAPTIPVDDNFSPGHASISTPIHVCIPYFQKSAIYKVSIMASDIATKHHASWITGFLISLASTVASFTMILFLL